MKKYIPYECGEDPVGDTRIKFNTRFYVIALIFLIFDVEVVFLLPWAVVFREMVNQGIGPHCIPGDARFYLYSVSRPGLCVGKRGP